MALIFKPKGTLNVATSPSKLPDTDMVRCKNLVLDRAGVITTRHGSSKVYDITISDRIELLLGQGEDLYFFLTGAAYYKDKVILGDTGVILQENGYYILTEDDYYLSLDSGL